MNRKLLVVVAVAAVLALLAGAAVGRNLLSSSTTPTAPRADVVRFKDDVAKVSIDYPASWDAPAAAGERPRGRAARRRRRLDVAAHARVSAVGLAPVTRKTLPIVRKFTDDLIAADPRAQAARRPRRRSTLAACRAGATAIPTASDASGGAHDHYFLFKGGRMIQLVFQAVPAERLPAVAPTFDRIAGDVPGARASERRRRRGARATPRRRGAARAAERQRRAAPHARDRPAPIADAVKIVAWLSIAAGAIHAIAMIDHFSHWWLYGVFFLVADLRPGAVGRRAAAQAAVGPRA